MRACALATAVLLAGGAPSFGQSPPDAPAPPANAPNLREPNPQAPNSLGPNSLAPNPQAPNSEADAHESAPPTTLEQRTALLGTLYARLAAAGSAEEAAPIAQAIERIWAYSGSPTADLLLERAGAAARASQGDLALKILDATVELQPDYAAAWNERAYLFYRKDDYQRALGDLRRVLALDPNHFRALDGLAQILAEIGQKKAALEAYKKLLAVHPQAEGARERFEELNREVEGQGI